MGTPSNYASQRTAGHHGNTENLLFATGAHIHTDGAMWLGHAAAVITTVAIYYAQRMIITVLAIARRIAAWVLSITRTSRVHTSGFRAAPLAVGSTLLTLPLGLYRRSVSWRGLLSVLSF
jgi:hypothetical protein